MEDYPQHDKAESVRLQMHGISEFFEYLDSQGYQLMERVNCEDEWGDEVSHLHNVHKSRATMIAECYGIDEKAFEQEKREMIERFRNL